MRTEGYGISEMQISKELFNDLKYGTDIKPES